MEKKASQHNVKLIVKLHPGNYDSDDLPSNKNIVWCKQVEDMAGLIKGSSHCLGFYSSLLVPCMLFKPVTLLQVFDHSFYCQFSENKNVQVIKQINELVEIPNYPEGNHLSDQMKYSEQLPRIINRLLIENYKV